MSTAVTKLAKSWGIPLVDATDSVVIHVQPQDVVGATCNDPTNCVFARAGKRQMGAEEIYVFRTTVTIKYAAFGKRKARLVRYLLAPDAQRAIRRFDESGRFAAATFQLDAPRRSQTLGAVRKRSKKRPGRHQPGNGKIKRTVIRSASSIRINTLKMTVG